MILSDCNVKNPGEANMNIQNANKLLLSASASILALAGAHGARAQQAVPAGQVEQVVVTGSRLTSAGFRAPTPVTVVGQEQLQKQAPATIAEALTQLPAFRNLQAQNAQTRLIGGSGQVQPDLRGLGAARTLTLVNGRRYPGSSTALTADMATIPMGMIDHVDVVTGGASAAYGSDAVAGVVNFVINSKFEGIKGSLQGGISKYDDVKEMVASFTIGHSFLDGRLHSVFGLDLAKVFDAQGQIADRPWGQTEPGIVANPANRPSGTPAQSILLGVESIYSSGGIVTAGPLKGAAFKADGTPYQFEYGTVIGTNMIGTRSNFGQTPLTEQQLYHPYERQNFMLVGSFDFTPNLQGFAEFNGAWNNNRLGYGDTYVTAGAIINIADPWIPASLRSRMVSANLSNVTVGRINDDISPWRTNTRWATGRALAGLRGELRGWNWEGYVERGRTEQRFSIFNMTDRPNLAAAINVIAGPGGVPICGPLATNPNLAAADIAIVEPGCVPFNVFGQGNTAQAVDYVTNNASALYAIDQTTAGFSVSGDAFDLPAGPASVALGGEWRKDAVNAEGDARSKVAANQSGSAPTYSGAQSVKEAFIEVGVPLLKDIPLAYTLDLNGAFRRTDYQLSGAVSTWKIGATWEPVASIRLRATKSRDIRAPSIAELFATRGSGGSNNIFNPFTNLSGRITTISGGNPELQPEIADSITAGIVLQPTVSLLSGLRTSFDYFSINMTGVIGSISAPDTIQRCFNGNKALCANIVFDKSAFGIFSVSGLAYNQASLKTRGYDIEVAYRVPLDRLPLEVPGRLDIRSLTTLVKSIEVGDGTVVTEKAGFANGGMPKVVGSVLLNYQINRLNLSLTARYFSDIHWDPALIGPDDPKYNPAASNSINRNLFPGQALFNVAFQYDLVARDRRGLQVFGTVNNLFDRQPNIQGAIAFNQNSPQLYDTVGRYYRLGLRFSY